MWSFFRLINRHRFPIVFVALEIIAMWLVVQHNSYQQIAFINSANAVFGNLYVTTNSVEQFFGLIEQNQILAKENAQLRTQKYPAAAGGYLTKPDTSLTNRYAFVQAKVVSNSIDRYRNFITAAKGSSHGVETGQGVIGPNGIVGIVSAVSKNYCVIHSLLHRNLMVSAIIKRSGVMGTVKWDGKSSKYAQLQYVARHNLPLEGDTIVTSGYSTVFPPAIPVGVVKKVSLNENETFYSIDIELATNFESLGYVYVAKDFDKNEITQLQKVTQDND